MRASRHERGVALVVVLWVGLLVAAIAAAFIVDTRTSAQLTRNFLDNSEARALADGGVHLAMFELVRPDAETEWQRDGRPYRRVVPGGTVDIAVEDEAGKIDLNKASQELLEGLFRSAGVDSGKSSVLVDAIDKIRKGEELRDKRPGANPAPPATARTSRRSRSRLSSKRQANLAFHSVDSLGQVPGMTAELYALLRPALTVFGDRNLHYPASPREALLAVPGVSFEAVDTFLLGRTGDDMGATLDEFLAEGQARSYWRRSTSKFITVKVLAQSENGAKFVRIALVEIAARDDQPFIVREWREGDTHTMKRYPLMPSEDATARDGAT